MLPNLRIWTFENNVGKEEDAGKQYFLLFSIMFSITLPHQTTIAPFELNHTCRLQMLLTLSQMTNFRLLKTERLCRRHFKFDENDRKFSKWVENTAEKGEITRYEQFLLFPLCFQKTCTAYT